MSIAENDWKYLSNLAPRARDRLFQRIIQEAQELINAAEEGKYHQTYLALYHHIEQQDRVVADCFDDLRRSLALFRLMHWREQRLITEEEFAGFSAKTRAIVDEWLAEHR